MRGTRWAIVGLVVAGAMALATQAASGGRAQLASLHWSASKGGPAVTSYDFGLVDGGSRVGHGFRLWNSSLTRSGQLAIQVTGSSAFSIRTDNCTGGIGRKTSCWVGVAYKPKRGKTSDGATLVATGRHGATASVTLSGSAAAPSPGHVYLASEGSPTVSRGGTLSRVLRGGGGVSTLASGQVGTTSVAVDGTNVYWADFASGTVNEVPLGGGGVTVLASGQSQPTEVAVDGTHVYWINYAFGTVNEVPIGGGSVTTLASGQSGPLALAVDGAYVYWSTADGAVKKAPAGGGTATTLATGQDANSLAVDGTCVYWTNDGTGDSYFPAGGTVNKVPIAGGAVTTLARGQHNPNSVAVGGTHVYWVTSGDSPGFPRDRE